MALPIPQANHVHSPFLQSLTIALFSYRANDGQEAAVHVYKRVLGLCIGQEYLVGAAKSEGLRLGAAA